MKGIILIVIVSFFSISLLKAQTYRYVTENGAGAFNGTSWANAYDKNHLQNAIDEAGVTDVWVAAGIYKPHSAPGLAQTDTSYFHFRLRNGVKVIGGFAGTEIPGIFNLADRDFETNETILSGNVRQDTVAADNTYHVIYNCYRAIPDTDENLAASLDSTAVLDGFTIADGYADGSDPADRGGGMYNDNCFPKIINCKFENNYSAGMGGAVLNTASGVYNGLKVASFQNCTFINNTAETNGSAVSNYLVNGIKITGCTFKHNISNSGYGTLYNDNVYYHLTELIEGCVFDSNTAVSEGGAIYNVGAKPKINNCIFSENTAGVGGAILNYWLSTTVQITNCVFSKNVATESGTGGGAIYNQSASTIIVNCTFVGNTAKYGGAIHLSEGTLSITNSIIWGNTAEFSGDQIFMTDGTVSINNSCYQSGANALTGYITPSITNCITTDPLFIDQVNGDYHLTAMSPCIETGTNGVTLVSPDIDGTPREYPTGTNVDMGAYEVGVRVRIDQAASQTDPTNASNIIYKVEFNTPVTGFTDGDVNLSGTAGATTAAITEIAPYDGTTYQVSVSGMAQSGTIIAAIDSSVAEDVNSQKNIESISTDNIITFDIDPPTGYSAVIEQPVITTSNQTSISFHISGAEVGATYNYTFSSSGGGAPVNGTGTITSTSQQFTSINLSGLNDGTVSVSVTLTDPLGNIGSAVTDSKTKDTQPPVIQSVAVPPDSLYRTFRNLDFIVIANESVLVDTAGGRPYLTLQIGTTIVNAYYQSLIGPDSILFRYVVQETDLDSDGVAVVGAAISLNGGSIKDTVGYNINTTLNNVNSTINVRVDGSNVAPNIMNIEVAALDYKEDQLLSITNSTIVNDSNSMNLEGAEIKFTLNYIQGEDELYFADTNGIAGNWNPTAGILELNGSSSVANYQTAIRNVKYRNTSSTPSTNPRKFVLSVNDGEFNSNTLSRSINVTPVNDLPYLAANNVLDVSEGSEITIPDGVLSAYDIDNRDEEILYIIKKSPSHGILMLGADKTISVKSFNNKDILEKRLRYKHDGSESAVDSICFRLTNYGTVDTTRMFTFKLNIIPVNDPPVIEKTPFFTINKNDTTEILLDTLRQYVSDPDNDIKSLVFLFITKDDKIKVENDSDTTYAFIPQKDWIGKDTLTMIVSDGSLSAQTDMFVNVNRFPEIVNLPELLEFDEGDSLELDLSGKLMDEETPVGELEVKISTSMSWLKCIYNKKDEKVLLSTEHGKFGECQMFITVTNKDGGHCTYTINIVVSPATGIKLAGGLPDKYALAQNYPNPFNPSTRIRFSIPCTDMNRVTMVQLKVYDILGREVVTLLQKELLPGSYEVEFNAVSLPTGIYFYRIRTGDYTETKKMMFIK